MSQRYQRGELVESAATLMATGADLGLKGLTNLKGLLKTAVSQIDGYAGPALAGNGCVAPIGAVVGAEVCLNRSLSCPRSMAPGGSGGQGYAPPQMSYQGGGGGGGGGAQRQAQQASGGWNGWDDAGDEGGDWRAPPASGSAGARAAKPAAPPAKPGGKAAGWAGWDGAEEIPDEVWDADWGK